MPGEHLVKREGGWEKRRDEEERKGKEGRGGPSKWIAWHSNFLSNSNCYSDSQMTVNFNGLPRLIAIYAKEAMCVPCRVVLINLIPAQWMDMGLQNVMFMIGWSFDIGFNSQNDYIPNASVAMLFFSLLRKAIYFCNNTLIKWGWTISWLLMIDVNLLVRLWFTSMSFCLSLLLISANQTEYWWLCKSSVNQMLCCCGSNIDI